MLNSGKKFALGATKKINILTLVRNFFSERNKQPLHVKWSVP